MAPADPGPPTMLAEAWGVAEKPQTADEPDQAFLDLGVAEARSRRDFLNRIHCDENKAAGEAYDALRRELGETHRGEVVWWSEDGAWDHLTRECRWAHARRATLSMVRIKPPLATYLCAECLRILHDAGEEQGELREATRPLGPGVARDALKRAEAALPFYFNEPTDIVHLFERCAGHAEDEDGEVLVRHVAALPPHAPQRRKTATKRARRRHPFWLPAARRSSRRRGRTHRSSFWLSLPVCQKCYDMAFFLASRGSNMFERMFGFAQGRPIRVDPIILELASPRQSS